MKKEEIEAKANSYADRYALDNPDVQETGDIAEAFTAGYQSALSEVERVREGGWVSVADKTPPIFMELLTWVKHKECMMILLWDGEEWSNDNRDTFIVTHWMELPEPPQP